MINESEAYLVPVPLCGSDPPLSPADEAILVLLASEEKLTAEVLRLRAENEQLISERDSLRAEVEQLKKQADESQRQWMAAAEKVDAMHRQEVASLKKSLRQLHAERNKQQGAKSNGSM
ncbi:MAG TPA: hypothetical protein VHN11_00335 [Xanthobacteraceae bacterium]|jgi:predicted RNase H-like nuclease (RuvC/YqgF family)|nr:hypothetical protein [Xanthobacteraceae bacterium]